MYTKDGFLAHYAGLKFHYENGDRDLGKKRTEESVLTDGQDSREATANIIRREDIVFICMFCYLLASFALAIFITFGRMSGFCWKHSKSGLAWPLGYHYVKLVHVSYEHPRRFNLS